MRNLLFWSLVPFLAPQALYVRRTAPRFGAAAGPTTGTIGAGRSRRLLAIGDSIIAGVGARHTDNALVATTAAALAGALSTGIEWQAFGQPGLKAADVVDRYLDRLPPEKAAFMIVSVGVNDITGLSSLSRWQRGLALLLRGLTAHSPGAAIAVAGIPPLGEFPLLPQPLRWVAGLRAGSFDSAARAVIGDRPNCVYVPVNFEAGPDRFAEDGYHPSEDSYRLFGESMARGLLSVTSRMETTGGTPPPDPC